MSRYLEGPIELPMFSVRARPVPPEAVEEPGRAEARVTLRVDESKALVLMQTLRDNMSRLTGKRASGAGKAQVYTARQVVEFATQMGLPTAGRKKEELVRAIKEKMREMGIITDVN